MPELTPADLRLMDALRSNARASVSDLARQLGLSRTTVQDRISRLESNGSIAGYTLRPNPALQAQQMRAHSLLRIDPKQTTQVQLGLSRIGAVQEVFSVAGEFDLLCVLQAPNAPALDAALDALAALDGVERTQSSVMLALKFSR